jgi:hypothetical protein
MAADYLVCPKCGNRVDEDDEGNERPIPTIVKPIQGRTFVQQAEFAYCQHCGAVLGIVSTPS